MIISLVNKPLLETKVSSKQPFLLVSFETMYHIQLAFIIFIKQFGITLSYFSSYPTNASTRLSFFNIRVLEDEIVLGTYLTRWDYRFVY